MMKHLQRLGKAMMLPVAVLPICGILMGLGYALAPAAMGAAGSAEGFAYVLGTFLIKAGGALINNMALLFAIGVGVGLAADNDGTAGLSGMVSYLMITTLLAPEAVQIFAPGMIDTEVNALAFSKIGGNAFIGILSGIIGGSCCNRFRSIRLPDALAFFSGKRFVAIATALASIGVSAVLLLVWPVLFGALYAAGQAIVRLGPAGAGLYVFLNRLLIPTGLHHALNNVFWFDAIGLGDLNAYWSGLVQGDTMNGNPVTWSVGSYMAGFFPGMMFGIPGAALAMIRTAGRGNRKAAGIVGASAVCAFLCGVTEPFEFAFMFLAFPLYVAYAALYGIFAWVTVALGFRAGFSFSAGATDLVFSASLPAAANTWLILPLGAAAFTAFYFLFRFAILRWDLKTPGREEGSGPEETVPPARKDYTVIAQGIVEGLGGRENIVSVDHCVTRLRLEVRDPLRVDEQKLRSSGAAGVIRPGKNAVQVVIGPKVQFVFEALRQIVDL